MNMKKAKKTSGTTTKTKTSPVATGAVKSKGRGRGRGNRLLSVPSAQGSLSQVLAPVMRPVSGSDGRIRVSHREYVMDILSRTTYNASKLSINPGLPGTFPWLSAMAKLYESYIFQRLQFEFQPSVGTSTSGGVVLAVDYDAFDYAPSNKSELMMQHGAVRGPLWSPVTVSCDQADLRKFGVQRYTRQATLAANLDIKTYDIGQLLVSAVSTSLADPSVVGELYVSYVVDLITPQSPNWPVDAEEVSKRYVSHAPTKTNPFVDVDVYGKLLTEITPEGRLRFNTTGEFGVEHKITGTVVTEPGPLVTLAKGLAEWKTGMKANSATSGVAQWLAKVTSAPAEFALSFDAGMATIENCVTEISPLLY